MDEALAALGKQIDEGYIVQIIPAAGWRIVLDDDSRIPIICWALTAKGHLQMKVIPGATLYGPNGVVEHESRPWTAAELKALRGTLKPLAEDAPEAAPQDKTWTEEDLAQIKRGTTEP